MAFYGVFMEEYLQAREMWLNHHDGRPFWLLVPFIEHPVIEHPEDIINDPPPAPAEEEDGEEIDVVGPEEEEIGVVGLDEEEEFLVEEPHGSGGGDALQRDEREEELNDVQAPSPPLLQEGPAAAPAVPPAPAAPAVPAAPPAPAAPAAPAVPAAPPAPAAYPAPAYAPAYANPNAAPFAAVNPAFLGYRYPPFAAPIANPVFPPPAAPPAPDPADSPEIPQLEPETLGPLTEEECVELFYCQSSLEEDPACPSTSGSSSKRRRSESDGEEPAAQRPRWSDDSDSD